MGIHCHLIPVSDSEIANLIRNQELVEELLWPDEDDLEGPTFERGTEESVEKTWEALTFLFTNTSPKPGFPATFLVKGGRKMQEVELDYGPPRAFRSADVAAINKFLKTLTVRELRSRYNPELMEKRAVYPGQWNEDPDDGYNLSYLMEHFKHLKKFVARTEKRGWGMIVYLA